MSMSSSGPYPYPYPYLSPLAQVDEPGTWIHRTHRARGPAPNQLTSGELSCSAGSSGVSA